MAGMAIGGLAGFAGMPQAYMQAQPQMLDQAAMEALGRGLQALSGTPVTAPTAPTAPAGGAPAPGGLLPRLAQLFGGGQNQPAGNFPGAQPIAIPGGSPVPGPAPGPPPTMAPPGAGAIPAGVPGSPQPAAAPPGGGSGQVMPGPQQGPLDWRQLARTIAQANPGAPPDVIAAALTKAMPLMNADSQQQWRLIQAQLAEGRLDVQREGLQMRQEMGDRAAADRTRSLDIREQSTEQAAAARTRSLDLREESVKQGERRIQLQETREQRLRENMEFMHDQKAKDLQMKAETARQKATQFGAQMDLKQRQNALKEMDTHQRAYDSYMRSKINAAANLSGQDKKDALKDLDRQWGEYDQRRRALQEELDQDAKGGTQSENYKRGADIMRQGGGQAFGPKPGAAKPLAADQVTKLQQYINQNPGQRDTVIHELQQQGYDTTGF